MAPRVGEISIFSYKMCSNHKMNDKIVNKASNTTEIDFSYITFPSEFDYIGDFLLFIPIQEVSNNVYGYHGNGNRYRDGPLPEHVPMMGTFIPEKLVGVH